MTDLAPYHFDVLRFPGQAGKLQQADDTDGLIAELGDNYGRYHEFLAQSFRAANQRIAELVRDYEPSDSSGYAGLGHGRATVDARRFNAAMDEYVQATALTQEIVLAEQLLRRARDARRSGATYRPDLSDLTSSGVIVDDRGRLMSDDPAVATEPETGAPPMGKVLDRPFLHRRDLRKRRPGDRQRR